ncbi:hypothetical protein G6F56_013646 [Rhizopus delemar]|nr:hypothetical protein G6F56_013646 [Rhizopus delemar]
MKINAKVKLGDYIPSHDTIKRRLKKVNQLTEIIQEYHVCPNGCYLYPKNDEVQTSCPNSECERPRYKNSLSQEPSQVMCVVSVAAFLADRLFYNEQREKFDYRHISDTEHMDGLYKDYNNVEVYRKLLQEQQGLFRGSRDIALIIVADGFQPHSQLASTLTTINCYIMNYCSMER